MLWRDTWAGTPGVAVITQGGEDHGQLDAVVLALQLDALPTAPVRLTNEHGHSLQVCLPRDVDAFSITTRIPLTVEVT
ncbi:hypothetical protein GO986_16210 [Deinococcus sp. HMF7620]|uniref:Uncharacterized protein n=1 Tax=Deinococcus arboris TaxID=2682977 RepID=A0A7C9I0B2_9DEIO|nr:hypothetical protein [Deinococcus arboris]MVN88290.1 hypothetical protein [Deinococcus arboris]